MSVNGFEIVGKSDETLPRIRDFFAKRSVLVTGGTGFMGMALIEGLLSASEEIDRIYVLVREKRDMSPAQRITRMLNSEIFNHHSEETKAKVIPLLGELTSENFGFSAETLTLIRQEVSVFYHNAAMIKFNRSLKEAIEMNVLTTLRAVELAKTLPKLSAFIYSSTMMSSSNRPHFIRETVYKTNKSPREMIRLAQEDPSSLDIVPEPSSSLIEYHLSSYYYSKHLAENLIAEEMSGLPAGIIRPSMVYGFYDHQIPGWMGNSKSVNIGVMRGYVKGIVRSSPGKNEVVMWAIPCDYVIKAMLCLTVSLSQRKATLNPEVVNLTSKLDHNPFFMKDFVTYLNEESWKNPCDSYLLLPRIRIQEGLRLKLQLLFLYVLTLFTYYPEKWFKASPTWFRANEMVSVQYNYSKIYKTLVGVLRDASVGNADLLLKQLHPDDKDKYNFDVRNVDWRQLIARSISWLRQYYFKDSNSVTWMHRVVQYIFLIGTALVYLGVFILYTYLISLITSSVFLGITLSSMLVAHWIWV